MERKLTKFVKEMDVLAEWPMSKATLIRARKNGLPFARLGAYVCYRPEDLEAWFCQPRPWRRKNASERSQSQKA
jgi:hypothetical protein